MTVGRDRFNVAANERGVSVNVIGAYDLDVPLAAVEEAIKEAARAAILRVRAQAVARLIPS